MDSLVCSMILSQDRRIFLQNFTRNSFISSVEGKQMENLQLRFLTNKQTIRWLSILDKLERGRSCSAKQMSDSTRISTRTVIKEMKDIREFFGDTIELTTNNVGYTFKERNYKRYNTLKRQLVAEDPLFVIMKSILEGELHTVEEWAFRFHVSESTMKRHILSVVPVLEEYEIQFSLTPVDLIGPEVNIRKFFKDFYYEVELTPHALLPFEEIQEMVFHLEKALRTTLETNISPTDFRYFLYIMIQRSSSGRNMPAIETQFVYSEIEKTFLTTLRTNILKTYQYEICDNELTILYIYIMAQRKITQPEVELNYCKRFNAQLFDEGLSREFLKIYDDRLCIGDLSDKVTLFLSSYFISTTWMHKLGEIMNKTSSNVIDFCREKFAKEYALTLQFLTEASDNMAIGEKYLEDIAVNLVLTVEAIRDIYVRNPHKIAFLLEGSFYVRRVIEAKVLRYLRGYHEIFFPTIEELTQTYFEENKIDLFVTNQEEYITELVDEIDFVVFKAIPDSTDWNHLLNRINPQITKDFSIERTISIEE